MTNPQISPVEKVLDLMASVFHLPVSELSLESTPDNTPQWDSLSHLTLITKLEEHYRISISHEDAVQLLSVADIDKYLNTKSIKFSDD